MIPDEREQQEKEELEFIEQAAKRYALLSEEKTNELVDRFKSGDNNAAESLVKHNLRLIISQAKKHAGKGVPVVDLVSEGVIGYYRGLNKFDPSKGFKLSTYVTWWIRQGIKRAIENKGKMIRIPSNKLQQANKVKWAYRQFLEKRSEKLESDSDLDLIEKSPDAQDLAEYCKLSIDQIKESGRYLQNHVSLDEQSGEDENLTLESYIAGPVSEQPEEAAEQNLDRRYIEEVLQQLNEEDRAFVLYRWGFIDNIERDHKKMSILTQASPEENKRREAEIYEKLRGLIDLSKLSSYSDAHS